MQDTMARYLSGFRSYRDSWNLRKILQPLCDNLSSQPVTSAGLVISGTILAKIGAADFYAVVMGRLVKIAAGTNMPSLVGFNFGAGAFNVACFFVDIAGTVTMLPGTQGATLGAVVFPEPPKNKALIGFLIVTYASAFTGGTTVLSTATTVYVSPIGGFDPTVLTGPTF
jgi:hypothetical protein